MNHQQQIKLDLDIYGVAYEQLQPNGTVKRLDPRNIRVIKVKPKVERGAGDDYPIIDLNK